MEGKNLREYLKLYIYYILIGVISAVSIIVFPIIGAGNAAIDITTTFPHSVSGWTLWTIVRIMIIVLNILIFSNFLQQAKINVKDNENYKEAINILLKNKNKEYCPRSPEAYMRSMYLTRGLGLVVSSVLSLFAIGNAILNYDYMLLIATVFTIIMSIIFGIMTMKKVELYYTTEFYDYAKNVELQKASKEAQNDIKNEDLIKSNIDLLDISKMLKNVKENIKNGGI